MQKKITLIVIAIALLTVVVQASPKADLITNKNVGLRITQLEFRIHILEQQIGALNEIISDYEKIMEKHTKIANTMH